VIPEHPALIKPDVPRIDLQSEDLLELPELDPTLLVRGQVLWLRVRVRLAVRLNEPLVDDSDLELDIRTRLSILAQDVQEVVAALFLEVELTHVLGVAVLGDIEMLGDFEVLGLLLGDVIDITGQGNTDIAKVGWDLEVEDGVFVVSEGQVLEGLGHREVVNIGGSGELDFDVLDQGERGLS